MLVKWVASIVGVHEVIGKDGTKIEVDVNAEKGDLGLDQEMRLSEPLLWESEFPPEADSTLELYGQWNEECQACGKDWSCHCQNCS